MTQPSAIYTLPWSGTPTDERRFRLIVAASLIVAVLMSALLQTIDIPKPERAEAERIPPRLAKMILEKKKIEPPPPPPKPVEPEPEPEPEPEKPEPKKEPEKKPEPKPVEKPKEKPKKSVEEARKKAANAGVLAMRDMLADLREAQPVETLTKKEGLQTGGDKEAIRSRSILTAKASKGSGGINTSAFSRSTAGASLGAHEAGAVEDMIGELEEETFVIDAAGQQRLARSDADIQRIFDASKAAIYTLYQRELRKNPLLQGKVMFKISIAPSGAVESCEIISSELNHKRLERKLVLKVKQINFGAKDVDTTVVNYPIDFFPNQ